MMKCISVILSVSRFACLRVCCYVDMFTTLRSSERITDYFHYVSICLPLVLALSYLLLCCLQIFSIVILGCVANEGYVNRPEDVAEFCIFNQNQNACSFAISMGTLSFLCSGGFLALDIYFPQISGVKERKKAVLADITVSGEAVPLVVVQ